MSSVIDVLNEVEEGFSSPLFEFKSPAGATTQTAVTETMETLIGVPGLLGFALAVLLRVKAP